MLEAEQTTTGRIPGLELAVVLESRRRQQQAELLVLVVRGTEGPQVIQIGDQLVHRQLVVRVAAGRAGLALQTQQLQILVPVMNYLLIIIT